MLTVVHVESEKGASRTGATAILPPGPRSRALATFPAAFAGDGAEMTGVQVLEEFGTISFPVILASAVDTGTVYDVALTAAFRKSADLSLGSGWPPVIIGIDDRPRHDVRGHRLTEEETSALFRDPVGAVRWGQVGAGFGATAFGGPGGIGGVRRSVGESWVEVVVLLAGGRRTDLQIDGAVTRPPWTESPEGSQIAIVIVGHDVGLRGLEALAHAGLEGLNSVGRTERSLALAVSVRGAVEEGGPQRRDLGAGSRLAAVERPVVDAVAEASRVILQSVA